MNETSRLAQVRWRSRRGMLELDFYLVPFAERDYARLSAAQQASYRELLERDDWDILDWLQRRQAPDARLADIIGRVRRAAETRPK